MIIEMEKGGEVRINEIDSKALFELLNRSFQIREPNQRRAAILKLVTALLELGKIEEVGEWAEFRQKSLDTLTKATISEMLFCAKNPLATADFGEGSRVRTVHGIRRNIEPKVPWIKKPQKGETAQQRSTVNNR
ncbi:hypothetical protein HY990_04750 [Candidatus Micrarchaeota archaeon]|nr:hypothetical protein [Candidatus Micrarchaeota archaeon]